MRKLHLPTLKYRRIRGDMIEVYTAGLSYKILSGKFLRDVINTKYLRIALDLILGNIHFHVE